LGFRLFSCFRRQIKSKPLFFGVESSQRRISLYLQFFEALALGFQLFSCFRRQIKTNPLFSGVESSQRRFSL
jgi:hypothetical protein